jgi:hypothetical protein
MVVPVTVERAFEITEIKELILDLGFLLSIMKILFSNGIFGPPFCPII